MVSFVQSTGGKLDQHVVRIDSKDVHEKHAWPITHFQNKVSMEDLRTDVNIMQEKENGQAQFIPRYATLYQEKLLTIRNDFDMTNYPFDVHELRLEMNVWSEGFKFFELKGNKSHLCDNFRFSGPLEEYRRTVRALLPSCRCCGINKLQPMLKAGDADYRREFRYCGEKVAFTSDVAPIGHTMRVEIDKVGTEFAASFEIVRVTKWFGWGVGTPLSLQLLQPVLTVILASIKYQIPVFDVADRASVDITLLLVLSIGEVGFQGVVDWIDHYHTMCFIVMAITTFETPLVYHQGLVRARELVHGMDAQHSIEMCIDFPDCVNAIERLDNLCLYSLAALFLVLNVLLLYFAQHISSHQFHNRITPGGATKDGNRRWLTYHPMNEKPEAKIAHLRGLVKPTFG